jgi:hypothetical protein
MSVSGIKHVSKQGNDLEEHRAGLETKAERQLKYHHDSRLEHLAAALGQTPTQVIAEPADYNQRTVRRL